MAPPQSMAEQADQLRRGVEELSREVRRLPEDALSAPLERWSPRDIVAHLIGWNEAIVVGCRQLMRGELPFYDVDPGPDYRNVNERFVRQWHSSEREDLLGDLERSAEELRGFLLTLDLPEWNRDSGVVHAGERLTIRSTVSDLVEDYTHHSAQIRDWRDAGGGSG